MSIPPRLMFEAMLARQGGMFTFEDVLQYIQTGRFQSWNQDETWVITQIHSFPRRKVLEIVWVVGDWRHVESLEERLIEWAKDLGIDMLMAVGREGFTKTALPGWKPVSRNFIKDLKNG